MIVGVAGIFGRRALDFSSFSRRGGGKERGDEDEMGGRSGRRGLGEALGSGGLLPLWCGAHESAEIEKEKPMGRNTPWTGTGSQAMGHLPWLKPMGFFLFFFSTLCKLKKKSHKKKWTKIMVKPFFYLFPHFVVDYFIRYIINPL